MSEGTGIVYKHSSSRQLTPVAAVSPIRILNPVQQPNINDQRNAPTTIRFNSKGKQIGIQSNASSSHKDSLNRPLLNDDSPTTPSIQEKLLSGTHGESCHRRSNLRKAELSALPISDAPVIRSNKTGVAIPSLPHSIKFQASRRSISKSSEQDDRLAKDMFKPRIAPLASRESCSSSTRSIRGSTITFHNVSYVVHSKKFAWSKPVRKDVLCGVSGIMKPGMNAIMGPTGSGKSSLLDALAGRKDPKYLTGEILVDGAAQSQNFKCTSGYVVQDDIVMGTLTVKENLYFSACLRLGNQWNRNRRKQKVDEVITELNLNKVANFKIGTNLIRGVSGGEKKRTNIGMELIIDPPVLFLDEPTTGLDSFTANSVIKLLRKLAQRGRTIIFSLHQPKYSIYKQFDTLTLVMNGNLVYQGTADSEPIKYFTSIGYFCEMYNSPPDFYMDIMHGEAQRRNPDGTIIDDSMSLSGIDMTSQLTDVQTISAIATNLVTHWKNSELYHRLDARVKEICDDSLVVSHGGKVHVKKGNHVSYPTNVFNQIIYVSWRTALNLFRNPESSVIQLAVYLFFCTINWNSLRAFK